MKKGMTLLEMMIVVLIFTFLFSAILTILATSDRSWRIGNNKLIEQQEARRAMDQIARFLRRSKPEWITIAASGFPNRDKILFYEVIFDDVTRQTNPGPWIVFKPDPNDQRLLVTKDANEANWNNVAGEIEAITFGGGCANCAAFNCIAVDPSCPIVRVDITTRRENNFTLTSYINLRNHTAVSVTLPEPPPEGEF
jgi:prepilin-type N-terminal cleavage/methylation domain-containing protein